MQELTAWQALASQGPGVALAPPRPRVQFVEPGRAYAVLVSGRLYAYGNTREQARRVFRAQIAGCFAAMRAAMWDRATFVELDDATASETAECIYADTIRWD